MKLSSLETLLQEKSPSSNVLRIEDFLNLVQKVIQEEESMSKGKSEDQSSESVCEVSFLVCVDYLYFRKIRIFSSPNCLQVGDKVELVEGYERYGDASNGPLHPGDRGTVVEVLDGPNGERYVDPSCCYVSMCQVVFISSRCVIHFFIL